MSVVVVFGNSNTWGYDPATGARFPGPLRWPSVLERELGADFEVIAEGLNGRTTVHDDPIEPYRSGAGCAAAVPHEPRAGGPRHSRARLQRPEEALFAVRLRHRRRGGASHFSRPRLWARRGRPRAGNPAHRPASDREAHRLRGNVRGRRDITARLLGARYSAVAEREGVAFLDAGQVIRCSDLDGIHYEADQHELLGKAAAKTVRGALAARAP